MNSETMQNKLIAEMNNVVKALDAFKASREKIIKVNDQSEIISAIKIVSSLAGKAQKNKPKLDRRELSDAIINLGYKMHAQFEKTCISESVSEFSFLKALKREYNENLHSDFIAALLNPKNTGKVAGELFSRLINFSCESKRTMKNEWAFQKPEREVSLDIFGQNKRLDILVVSEDRVLAIENKVHSIESENQTVDYFNILNEKYQEKLVCLLLSPTGMTAQCSKFRPISYLQFFKILIDVRKSVFYDNQNIAGLELCDFYIRELRETLVSPAIKANELTGEFLKGVAHGQ